jgi:hypothetical protein
MKELEIETKKVWFWPNETYVKPFALSMEDWEAFDNKVKKNYPVQYFFRNFLVVKYWILKRKINDFVWKLRHYVKNPRTEMRDIVFPSRYEDLPEIIINFNIQIVKELVEREKYFEHFESQLKARNKRGQFERDLKKYYHYVTVTREEMTKEVADLLSKDNMLPFKKGSNLWTKKIKKIEKLDEEMIIWIAKYRQYFWT